MRIKRLAMIAATVWVGGAAAMSDAMAQAQAPAAPAATPDPAFEAARKAFEALPESDRRALQDALIWTGDYKGSVDGGFGRGTRDAIAAYAKRANQPTDGTLNDKARVALTAAGAKLRNAAAFKSATDARSGMSIGIPTKALPKKSESTTGARYTSADGGATLDLFGSPDAGSDLAAMFDKLKADAPGRKVTYRISRPDFFVVSGDASGKSFYTRVARGTAANGNPMLRGYTLSYPAAAKATFDIYSIAIASSFAPFGAPVATVAATGQAALGAPPPAAPVARSALSGTAVAVAPGRAVAVLSGVCNAPQVGGRKANQLSAQPQSGLTIFDVPGLNATPLGFGAASAKTEPVVVLQQAAIVRASSAAIPAAAQATPSTDMLVAPGEWSPASTGGAPRLLAPLQPGAAGAAVFSRSGALIGLVGNMKTAPKLVAGIAPQTTTPGIAGEAVAAFLQTASVAIKPPAAVSGDKGAADIAAAAKGSILPLVCSP